MKNLLRLFFALLFSFNCMAAVNNGVVYNDVDNWDTVYTWSYGALADTMKTMRVSCETTHKDEFLQIGNWFRGKGAKLSFRELVDRCQKQEHPFHNIIRDAKNPCEMPHVCTNNDCGEKKYTDISGCNVFLSALIKNTNVRAQILKNGKPGTYVKRVKFTNNETAYKVFDVKLAPGYWKNGKIDNNVNNNPENTKIYEVKSDGTIVDTGMKTWTNDMFFDTRAAANQQGDVGGAFVNSYIRPSQDLTKDINAMYKENVGSVFNSVENALSSRQGGAYDVKAKYSEKFKVKGQENNEPDSNGVMVFGKIAHLDWLGHALYGMNREESSLPDAWANRAAQGLSVVSDKGKEMIVAGVSGGVPAAAYVVDTYAAKEPLNMQNAWDIGAEWAKTNKRQRINKFANVETRTKEEAYQKAKTEMMKIYPDAKGVTCDGDCHLGGQDLVTCTDSKNRVLDFVFGDICD